MLPYTERREGQLSSDALANRLWFGAEARTRRSESSASPTGDKIATENRPSSHVESEKQKICLLLGIPTKSDFVFAQPRPIEDIEIEPAAILKESPPVQCCRWPGRK
jgi:hypothetical protein